MKLGQIIRGALILGALTATSSSLVSNVIAPTKKPEQLIEETKAEVRTREELEAIIENFQQMRPHLNTIIDAVEKNKQIYQVDPLLIVAIAKVESSSNPYAVSWVGAGGLFQIMPKTAEEYGFNVIITPNFTKGWQEWRKFIKQDQLAHKAFDQNNFNYARRLEISADNHYQKALGLFKDYKKEVLTKIKGKTPEEILEIDQRFHIPSAINFCVETMAKSLNENKGDMRVAIATYNAGMGAVRKYKGIPPFKQTVIYQNKVINTYNMLQKLIAN